MSIKKLFKNSFHRKMKVSHETSLLWLRSPEGNIIFIKTNGNGLVPLFLTEEAAREIALLCSKRFSFAPQIRKDEGRITRKQFEEIVLNTLPRDRDYEFVYEDSDAFVDLKRLLLGKEEPRQNQAVEKANICLMIHGRYGSDIKQTNSAIRAALNDFHLRNRNIDIIAQEIKIQIAPDGEYLVNIPVICLDSSGQELQEDLVQTFIDHGLFAK